MITLYIISLIILISIPTLLYFNKLEDVANFIKKIHFFFEKRRKNKFNIQRDELQSKIDWLTEQNENLTETNAQLTKEAFFLRNSCTESVHQNNNLITALEIKKKEYRILGDENTQLKVQIAKLEQQLTQSKQKESSQNQKDYRKNFPAELRCKSGIYVRSKSERDIIDFFFDNRVKCEYERTYTSPINKQTFSADFYLPDHNLYIEYFGMDDSKYNEKKDLKIRTYKIDKNINFEYLTHDDDNLIYDKLREICGRYKIKVK